MKRKLFTPALLLAMVIFFSGFLSMNVVSSKNFVANVSQLIIPGATGTITGSQPEVVFFFHGMFDIDSNGMQHEETCRLRQFHFERIKKLQPFCNLWCILARMIVVVSHLSVLMYAFKAIIN